GQGTRQYRQDHEPISCPLAWWSIHEGTEAKHAQEGNRGAHDAQTQEIDGVFTRHHSSLSPFRSGRSRGDPASRDTSPARTSSAACSCSRDGRTRSYLGGNCESRMIPAPAWPIAPSHWRTACRCSGAAPGFASERTVSFRRRTADGPARESRPSAREGP